MPVNIMVGEDVYEVVERKPASALLSTEWTSRGSLRVSRDGWPDEVHEQTTQVVRLVEVHRDGRVVAGDYGPTWNVEATLDEGVGPQLHHALFVESLLG